MFLTKFSQQNNIMCCILIIVKRDLEQVQSFFKILINLAKTEVLMLRSSPVVECRSLDPKITSSNPDKGEVLLQSSYSLLLKNTGEELREKRYRNRCKINKLTNKVYCYIRRLRRSHISNLHIS